MTSWTRHQPRTRSGSTGTSALLAAQYARGGRAGRYYLRAAVVASGVFAHAEAIRLYREALSLVGKLPAGTHRDRQELTVLEALAAPLNARYGHSSPDLQHTVERSIDLARSLGRTESMLTSMYALWSARFVQGRTSDSRRVAERALRPGRPGLRAEQMGPLRVGGSCVSMGMPAIGLRHFDLSAARCSMTWPIPPR